MITATAYGSLLEKAQKERESNKENNRKSNTNKD